MRCLDLTLPTAAANLALDEALLTEAEADRGDEVLRLWEWSAPAVVLGSGGVLADDVEEPAALAAGVPILRRSSGGGTVLWGPGSLLFSLVLPYDRDPALADLHASYAYILERIGAAVGGAAAGVRREGICDLTLHGRKFSGNAQQRKRRHLLHHGTLLYAFDLDAVGRYLKEPPRQPDYRAGRDHRDFLCNLPLDAAELKRRLRQVWRADEDATDWPRTEVDRLRLEKYERSEWTRRR
jgi:lipoate-protein ligase A